MEDKKWTIYKHTSPSGKSYIGLTSKDPEKRWLEGAGYNPKTKFGKAISKYGWEQFSHEILEDGISTLEEAQEREKFWIKHFDTFKNGYNSTEGGDTVAPDIVSKRQVICYDTKEVFESTIAAAEKYQVAHTNISRACRNCIKVKGKYFVYLDEYSENWRPRTDGRTNESKKAKVLCQETGQEFESVREAARTMKITPSLISRCCNGILKSTHNYHFCFIKEREEI